MLPSLTLQSAMKVAAIATSAAMMEFSRDSDACSTASLMVSLMSDIGESYLAGLFRSNYILAACAVVTSASTSAQYERSIMSILPRELASRYEVLAMMGEGGMGAVYKVRDNELDRICVIKVMHLQLQNNP